MGTSLRSVNPVRKHRRDVWLKIILPVALPVIGLIALVIVLLVAAANGSLASKQVGIVMSILATCFLALPAMLLCLLPYALLAVIAALAGKGYAHAQVPVRFLRRITGQVAAKTHQVAPRVAGPITTLNVQLTRWEETLSNWLQWDSEKDRKHG